MLHNYIKLAWRNIIKNKLYTLINVIGLSMGIAVCLLISLYVKDEFSFDRFQSRKNAIYRLVVDETSGNNETNKFGDTGMTHGEVFKKQVPELQSLVRIQGRNFNIKNNNEVFDQSASQVDSAFFSVFDAEFIEGNADNVLSSPTSIVISEKVRQRFFGNQKALGKKLSIEIEDVFKDYTITGVTANSPENSSIQIELLMPFDYAKAQDNSWISFYLNTFFLIKEGVDLTKIENKFDKIFQEEAKEQLKEARKQWNYTSNLTFKLQPFLLMHLSEDYRAQNGIRLSGNKLLSYVLSSIALFILLIASINFINISVSRSGVRAKEIGVRKAIGGQKMQLVTQFMSESFILCLAAFLLALIWVQFTLPTFNHLTSKALSFSYLLDVNLMIIFSLIFLVTTFLAGFYPSLVLASLNPVETLYGRYQLKSKNILQKILIVLQFGLASFFIIMTLVQIKQVNLFINKDLGYDDNNIIIVNNFNSDSKKAEIFMQQLKEDPNIISVAPRNAGTWITKVDVNGNQQISPDMNLIDKNYFPALGLKVIQGRNYSDEFPGDSTQSIIVNEAFVKVAKWKEAIGQDVKIMNDKVFKVIGVVKDYHYNSLYENINPQVFLTNLQYGSYGKFIVKTYGKNNPASLNFIKAAFFNTFPTKPYFYEYLTDVNDAQYEKEKQMRQIILWTALLMIFISCIGLFGLSVLTTEKRQKEIGIRKVVGGSVFSIMRKMSYDFIKLILIAFLIFAPIAYYAANSLLQNYPYRINLSFDMFLISFIALLFLTLATISYQTIKAARVNPVKSLRSE